MEVVRKLSTWGDEGRQAGDIFLRLTQCLQKAECYNFFDSEILPGTKNYSLIGFSMK